MANISKNSEQKYTLDGISRNAPIEWEDVTIEADYVNDSVQPSLTVEDFDFTLEARDAINQWIEDGRSSGVGIFEGMPFELTLFNNEPLQEHFKAFIDFTNNYNDLIEDGKVSVSIMKDGGLDNFFDQIGGTTFGYLEHIGVITSADYETVDYVVEKKFNLFEILMTSIILFIMIKELAVSVRNTANQIGEVSRAAGNTPFNLGDLLYNVILALINVVYTAVLLLAIIELTITLIETLVPKKRQHKAILLKRALEIVANHFGYQFVTSVEEYDNVYYLPSNPNLDEKTFFGLISSVKGVQKGIPNVLDFGYRCDEMFQIAKDMPYAKMAIIGNTIHLRPINDPFWIQQSTWNFPNVLIVQKAYNVNEMRADRLLTFETDLNDEWTIDNYEGTAFEIRTEPITIIRDRAVLLKGLEEVNFKTCLGNRKDSLNAIENLLKLVTSFVDGLTGVFGGGTNFSAQIQSKVGVLKQTSNWHSVPKILYLRGGKLPTNHRDLFNAKLLYDKYHKEKSFVLDNWRAQKTLYNDVDIPFGFNDYKELTTNPYFFFKGKQAKITKFTWTVGQDRGKISFWVREPYTFNLKEAYINPS